MGNKISRRHLAVDERYTRPQGLYANRDVDQRKLRRLILDAKLAPCFPSGEEPAADLEECPICFLYYPSLNRSKCCTKGVCTECFLQMKSSHSARPTQCPFCKTSNYAVEFRGAKTLLEKGVEQVEEQKVIEAKIRMRQQELQADEEREQQRKEDKIEGNITPHTPRTQFNDEHPIESVPLEERERQSSQDNVGHLPQQVKPLTDYEKCRQHLCEPSYCHEQQWTRKTPAPRFEALSFTMCGAHCAPDCPKCLMAFHKQRGYDVFDVISPPPGVFKEDQIVPSLGRWRSTWGNLDAPLSRSFPLPSRVPEYHCRHVRILEPAALGHELLDISFGPSWGQHSFKAEKEEFKHAPITSVPSNRPSSDVDSDLVWVHGGLGSEEGLDADASQHQSTVPLPPDLFPPGQQPTDVQFSVPQPPPISPRPLPPEDPLTGFARQRDDEFDFDLEDIMVMEAIWLSIQEQGSHSRSAEPIPNRSLASQLSGSMTEKHVNAAFAEQSLHPPPRRGSEVWDERLVQLGTVTGSLAGAIAALAERQATGMDASPSSQQTIMSLLPLELELNARGDEKRRHRSSKILNAGDVGSESRGTTSESHLQARCGMSEETTQTIGILDGSESCAMPETIAAGFLREDDVNNKARDLKGLADLVGSKQQIERGLGEYQNSEQLGVGTSFSSNNLSVSNLTPEPCEVLPTAGNGVINCEANNRGKVVLPESYEEQMMLAMALSIADAQLRVFQENSNSGPVVQHTSSEQ